MNSKNVTNKVNKIKSMTLLGYEPYEGYIFHDHSILVS